MNTSFFGEMLQSIAERGRALVTRDRRGVAEQRSANLAHLCEDLLSRRGEASGVALAREIRARVHDRFGVTLVPEPVFVNVSLD